MDTQEFETNPTQGQSALNEYLGCLRECEQESDFRTRDNRYLKEGNYDGYMSLRGRNNSYESLMDIRHFTEKHEIELAPKAWAALVRLGWEMTDLCSYYLTEWTELIGYIEPEDFMTEAEIKHMKSLPNRVTLYRGYCAENGTKDGMSWTTDRKLAEFFSTYRTSKPAVVKKVVGKNSIFARFKSRDGWEFLIPDYDLI